MSKVHLTHISQAAFPLTENCSINSFTISTDDATKLDSIRTAYGGTVEVSLYKQSDLIYETVIVTSVNTGTGVVTVSANIEYYEEYTTSNQAGISFNMAADGFCEFDGLRNIYEPLWNWGSTEPIFSELIYPFSAYD